jgi:hypothetical protein
MCPALEIPCADITSTATARRFQRARQSLIRERSLGLSVIASISPNRTF